MSASALRRLLWAALGVVLVGVSGAGILSWRERLRASASEPLPVLGQVPEFRLLGRGGASAGSAELAGRPWVASFLFTRCSTVCPAIAGTLAGLQGRLESAGRRDVRLVSISVDPEHDTPERLAAYGRGFGADPERWWFLTGPRDSIHTLVRDGFKLSLAEAPPGAAVRPEDALTHSDRLVLVDARLRIRGYYHGREVAAVERLLADLARLERE